MIGPSDWLLENELFGPAEMELRLSTPQQLIDNGRLTIAVTDGFIEEVDASSLNENIRAIVLRRTNFLVGRRHVRLSEIERCLLIAADTPGIKT